ncbi:MAG: tetratricopeptide repeat protein [Sedimentisphaerales bacterium]|nr:tetratricopeptide repeat protein [Sedimentisphaerales bacterium]
MQLFSKRVLVSVSFLILVLIILAASLQFICRTKLISKEIRNVILISIDTCRADRLSCYGYPLQTTPNIDALASQGILFENCYSPVPLTLPAHISMLSGTIPPYHGIHDNHDYGLDESLVTIAEILKDDGFTTGSIISAFVLDSRTGLNQGFETYNDDFEEKHRAISIVERKAEEVSRVALDWLNKNKDDRFFLFLHYYDPHNPYHPPEPFSQTYSKDLYAGEIAYVDHCIGQVIEKLKKLGLYDSTLIIVTGDHGEMLGEHNESTHGYFIYQSALKVPLIFTLPGWKTPTRVKDMVGLIDIVPTICSLLDIENPPKVQGIDLSGHFHKKQPLTKHIYLYCESLYPTKYSINMNPVLGVITDNNFKYIETTRPELYNLSEDPGENNNLIHSQSQRAHILQDCLKQILTAETQEFAEIDSQLDTEAFERLRTLGYVGGAAKIIKFDSNKDDPKDFIEYHTLYASIPDLINKEKYDLARSYCSKILQNKSYLYQVYFHLGRIAKLENKIPEAISHWKKVLLYNSENVEALNELSMTLVESGQLEEAIIYFEKAVEIGTVSATLCNNLGATFAQVEKYDQAITYFKKSFEIYPGNKETHFNLLRLMVILNQIDEAHQYVEKIAELAGENGYQAFFNFGILLVQQQKVTPAIEYFQKTLKLNPDFNIARFSLAQALSQQGRLEEAIKQYEKLLQFETDKYMVHNRLAELLFKQKKANEAFDHLIQSQSLKPDQPEVLDTLAKICKQQGEISQAVEYWQQALKLRSDWPEVLNYLAWIKATSEDSKVRNPKEAVQLAQRSCELRDFKDPQSLDTLAAAYAAEGNFTKAVEIAQNALDIASSAGLEKAAHHIKSHLDMFKSGQPYFESEN